MKCEWAVLCEKTTRDPDQAVTIHRSFTGLTAKTLPAQLPVSIVLWFLGTPGERADFAIQIIFPDGSKSPLARGESIEAVETTPFVTSSQIGPIPLAMSGRYYFDVFLNGIVARRVPLDVKRSA